MAKVKVFTSKILIIFFFFSTFFAVIPSDVQAAASMYFSPSSKTVTKDTNLVVAIRVNSESTQINFAQANVTYPADKFSFVNVSYTGSKLSLKAEETIKSGSINLGRSLSGGDPKISGDFLFATLTFKAWATGTADLKFASGSIIVEPLSNPPFSRDILNGNWSNGTYTIKAASSTAPGGGSTPAGSTGTTSTSTSTTAKKDSTAPKISGVQVSGIGFNTATISWKTNERATSVLEYGQTKKLVFISFDTKLKTDHKIVIPKNRLTTGTRYNYKISSKDAAGNSASTKQTSFKTKGYSVKLRVLDLAGNPLGGAKITLAPGFDTSVADKNGVALFVGTAPGKHAVTIEIGDQKLAEEITVEEIKDPAKTQEFVLKIAAVAIEQGVDVTSFIPLLALVAIAILVITGGWMGRNYLLSHRRMDGGSGSGDLSPTPKNKPEKPADKETHYVNLDGLSGSSKPANPQATNKPESPNPVGQTIVPRGEKDLLAKNPNKGSDTK